MPPPSEIPGMLDSDVANPPVSRHTSAKTMNGRSGNQKGIVMKYPTPTAMFLPNCPGFISGTISASDILL